MILSSALSFGFLHIMYDNAIAVGFTLLGGLVFSISYTKSRRLLVPTLEHSLYGLVIFTSGLGRFFYEPIP